MDKKFSLKDLLFNKEKVAKIADEISFVYPTFVKDEFIQTVINRFPELELKQRISWIAQTLRKYLPNDFQTATKILLKSLPPANDPTKIDDDFGDFIYAPYAEFVAKYGCSKSVLRFSLASLKEITQRFSAEDAIRYFINAFPDETMKELLNWSRDSHYHVRRLVSEGTRPKLPWAQKITIPIESALPILDNLYTDNTRFVTRSVANHLNDISKTNPELVLKTLEKWQASGRQNSKEMEYIVNHSLRTLIKQGYLPAFTFLKFSNNAEVALSNFEITSDKIKIGSLLNFSFTLTAMKDENILIDYIISFQNKKGLMNSQKVFKLKKLIMKEGEVIQIQKAHPMREQMTTRTLYPGGHNLEIQINGAILASRAFELIK